MFQALLLNQDERGFRCTLEPLAPPPLAEGEVRVRIEASTLNYKDALALTNRGPVVRRWPMVPGIDGAGTVIESRDPRWPVGAAVLHNGWGVGETRWGCLAAEAVLPGSGLLALPAAFTAEQAMALGTAGYTAALCVLALERHGLSAGSELLVTGATGGVGSVAVALLARAGHRVVAGTGKLAEADYLRQLGAAELMDRALLAAPGKPLQKERWSAAVDAAGGPTLANALAQTRYGGAVAACGLAHSAELATTVMPFILRGVALLGIDSVMAPMALREAAWARLARDLDPALLATMTMSVSLAEAPQAALALMEGRQRGRVVIRV